MIRAQRAVFARGAAKLGHGKDKGRVPMRGKASLHRQNHVRQGSQLFGHGLLLRMMRVPTTQRQAGDARFGGQLLGHVTPQFSVAVFGFGQCFAHAVQHQSLAFGVGFGKQRVGGIHGGKQGFALIRQTTFADGKIMLRVLRPFKDQQALLAHGNGGAVICTRDHRQRAVQPAIIARRQLACRTASAVLQRVLPDEVAAALAVGGGHGMGKGQFALVPQGHQRRGSGV